MNQERQNKSMKIAIIGGGTCGLYLAWKLSEMTHKVTVFERKREIGKEVCSGLFSKRILDFFPQSEKLIQNNIRYVLIHFPKKEVRVDFSKNFFVMSHFELDNLIYRKAQEAGAKIVLNRNIKIKDLVEIQKNFDKIIGSEGSFSIVRKSQNLSQEKCRLALLGFTPSVSKSDYVEAWPVKEGFIWKIPRGEEIEYGIIGPKNQAQPMFEAFLEKNNICLKEKKSSFVSQGFALPCSQKITLCGEAAGLTKPWSGGGVIWGLTAADMLLESFPDFERYRKMVKQFFLPKIFFSKIVNNLVYFFGFRFPWIFPKRVKIESDFLV